MSPAGGLLVLPGDLAELPRPGHGKQIDPDEFPIARGARMSMSIPYFFDPVELEDTQGRTCLIVDGGTLSNFPVWLWDIDPKVSGRRPDAAHVRVHTQGRQGLRRPGRVRKVAPWHLRFAFEIFHTAESAWDERFASNSTRVRTLAVDAGDVGTTNSTSPTEKQEMLIHNGRDSGEGIPRLVLARAVREHVPRGSRAEPGGGRRRPRGSRA